MVSGIIAILPTLFANKDFKQFAPLVKIFEPKALEAAKKVTDDDAISFAGFLRKVANYIEHGDPITDNPRLQQSFIHSGENGVREVNTSEAVIV